MDISIYSRLAATSVLTIIFLYLFFNQKKKYLLYWAVGWFIYAASYVYRITVNTSIFEYYQLFFEIITIADSIFWLWGGLASNNKPFSKKYILTIFLISVWIVLRFFYDIPFFGFPYGTASNFLYAVTLSFSGYLFLNSKFIISTEKYYTGSFLVLLGIDNLLYPWTIMPEFIEKYPMFRLIDLNIVLSLQILIAVSIVVVFFKEMQNKLNDLHVEHSETLTKVIQGFIPICSKCKSIREKDKSWTVLEKYIDEHTDAQLTHGICPKCTDDLYGDFLGRKKN